MIGRSKPYGFRKVLWSVTKEYAIEISDVLVSNGITDFYITPHQWLVIKVPHDCYVKNLMKEAAKL